MKKMKIFFLSDNFPPERNAAATRVGERGVYWVEWGHELTVLTSVPNFPEGKVYPGYKNRWFQRDIYQGIRVVRVKTLIAANKGFAIRILDFLSYMVTSFFAGIFLIKKDHDVIVVTSPQFFSAISAWALSKVKGKPFVFELGDLWPESIRAVGVLKSSWILDQIEKVELFLYRQSKAVIALTDDFKANLIARGIPADKIYVVKNGVDLRRHIPAPKDVQLVKSLGLEGRFVISYMGTMGVAQDLIKVLEIAKSLQTNSESRVVFLFVGTGVDELKLRKYSHDNKLSNVIFVDPQPKERIGLYWNLSDVALVHLRNSETFKSVIPSKMFEAMGYGKPVLMISPSGEASEILTQNHCGWHFDASENIDLAEKIMSIVLDREDVIQRSKSSLISSKKYTRENQARKFIKVLEEI